MSKIQKYKLLLRNVQYRNNVIKIDCVRLEVQKNKMFRRLLQYCNLLLQYHDDDNTPVPDPGSMNRPSRISSPTVV